MELPKRKSPRIPGYDYSSVNYYFITICTRDKKCIFGHPGKRNVFRTIAQKSVEQLPIHFYGVVIDKYVIMPNHVHMIIVLNEHNKADLSQIIAQYKSGVTREIRKISPNEDIWQRSYHDHIIRNQKSYEKIWMYIENNPQKWEDDCFYIENV